MSAKIISLALVGLVMNLFLFSSGTLAGSKKERRTAKVKAGIARLGTGPDARVLVKLKDGTKLKGYISETTSQSFKVVNDATGTTTEVSYSQTKQVKGNNLSKGVTIAVAVGLFVALGILYAVLSE